MSYSFLTRDIRIHTVVRFDHSVLTVLPAYEFSRGNLRQFDKYMYSMANRLQDTGTQHTTWPYSDLLAVLYANFNATLYII